MESLIIAIPALVVAISTAIKQILDNKELKKWVCIKNPCDQRIRAERTPEEAAVSPGAMPQA